MHIAALSFALLICLAAPLAAAQDREGPATAERRVGGDLFIGGGSIAVHEAVPGDLFGGGGSIDVGATGAGDAGLVGGKLRLGADIGRNAYAAGGQVNLVGKVGGNARLAGGQVDLGPKSDVAGNVSVAGGQVRLGGSIKGHVQAAGGRLTIDGPVGGDVTATSGRIVLGPNARIAGKLRHRSGEPIERDAAAEVAGGVEVLMPVLRRGDKAGAAPPPPPSEERGWRGPVGTWTIGLMLLAAFLVALLPAVSQRVARSWRERFGWSLLAGFALLVCVPVATLLFAITIIGLPVALALVAAYFALMPVAYVATAIAAGDWALQRWQAAKSAMPWWRIGAACAAVLLLALLGAVPWLGGLVALTALVAGLGAIVLQFTPMRPAA
mgnify:CR=1 FL=1